MSEQVNARKTELMGQCIKLIQQMDMLFTASLEPTTLRERLGFDLHDLMAKYAYALDARVASKQPQKVEEKKNRSQRRAAQSRQKRK